MDFLIVCKYVKKKLDEWQIILHQKLVILTGNVMEAELIIYKDKGVYIEIEKCSFIPHFSLELNTIH